MKTIKNVMVLLVFIFTLTGIYGQSGETKDLLINKWVIDKDAMKPVIEKVLAKNPQYLMQDEVSKKQSVNTVIDQQLSGIKIEYKKDRTYTKSDPNDSNTTGNWTLDTNGRELTTKSGDKPEKKYTIVNISKTKLHLNLIGKENSDLFLKVENQ